MRLRKTLFALLVIALGSATGARATEETGAYSGPNQVTGNSKNTSLPAHEVPGTVTTDLAGTGGGPHGTWLDATAFPLAGIAGIVPCTGGPTKYPEQVSITEKQVKIKSAQQVTIQITDPFWNRTTTHTLVGEGTLNLGSFPANCHMEKKAAAPTTVPTGGPVKDTGVKFNKDGEDRFELYSWVCSTGGVHVFHFVVTNNYDHAVDFSWPAVHTADYPDGWSGAVGAGQTLEYSCEAAGTAVRVHGTPGAVTAHGDATVVVARAVAPAWCPTSAVSIPSAVTNLAATNGPATVTLTWTLPTAYDSIQIFRVVSGLTESRAWEIDGTELSFVDDDPPAGTVTYTVIGVADGLGNEENPSTSVNRN